jgi:hypothetical protein
MLLPTLPFTLTPRPALSTPTLPIQTIATSVNEAIRHYESQQALVRLSEVLDLYS